VTPNAYQTSNTGHLGRWCGRILALRRIADRDVPRRYVVRRITGIAVAADGDIVVGGDTASRDFPIPAGAFQTSCLQCITIPVDSNFPTGFISELKPDLSALVFSTYLGSVVNDGVAAPGVDGGGAVYANSTFLGGWNTGYGSGVAVDSVGDAWLTGQARS
jgi:hypothetical protein